MKNSFERLIRRSMGITGALFLVATLIGGLFASTRFYMYGAALGLLGSMYCIYSGARQAQAVRLVAEGIRRGKPRFGVVSRLSAVVIVVFAAVKLHYSVLTAVVCLYVWLVASLVLSVRSREG